MKLLELKLRLLQRLDKVAVIIARKTKGELRLYGAFKLYEHIVWSNLNKDELTDDELKRTIEIVGEMEKYAQIISK